MGGKIYSRRYQGMIEMLKAPAHDSRRRRQIEKHWSCVWFWARREAAQVKDGGRMRHLSRIDQRRGLRVSFMRQCPSLQTAQGRNRPVLSHVSRCCSARKLRPSPHLWSNAGNTEWREKNGLLQGTQTGLHVLLCWLPTRSLGKSDIVGRLILQ